MPAAMCLSVPSFNARCGVRYSIILVPLVSALLDDPRYFLPGQPPPPVAIPPRRRVRSRGPRLSTLLRLARTCHDRDEFAAKLRKRLVKAKVIRPPEPRPD